MEALNMYLITACFRFWSFWKREPGLKCTLQYWLKIRFCWIMNQKCKIEGVLPLSPLGWIISDIQCSALSNVSFCSIRILIMNYWACKLIYVSIIFIAFCVGLSDNKPTKYLISIETGVPGRWVIFEWVHCPPVRRQFHWYLLPAPTKCKYWLISINRTKKYVSKLISIFVFILITSFTVLVKLLRNKLDFSHTF